MTVFMCFLTVIIQGVPSLTGRSGQKNGKISKYLWNSWMYVRVARLFLFTLTEGGLTLLHHCKEKQKDYPRIVSPWVAMVNCICSGKTSRPLRFPRSAVRWKWWPESRCRRSFRTSLSDGRIHHRPFRSR